MSRAKKKSCLALLPIGNACDRTSLALEVTKSRLVCSTHETAKKRNRLRSQSNYPIRGSKSLCDAAETKRWSSLAVCPNRAICSGESSMVLYRSIQCMRIATCSGVVTWSSIVSARSRTNTGHALNFGSRSSSSTLEILSTTTLELDGTHCSTEAGTALAPIVPIGVSVMCTSCTRPTRRSTSAGASIHRALSSILRIEAMSLSEPEDNATVSAMISLRYETWERYVQQSEVSEVLHSSVGVDSDSALHSVEYDCVQQRGSIDGARSNVQTTALLF